MDNDSILLMIIDLAKREAEEGMFKDLARVYRTFDHAMIRDTVKIQALNAGAQASFNKYQESVETTFNNSDELSHEDENLRKVFNRTLLFALLNAAHRLVAAADNNFDKDKHIIYFSDDSNTVGTTPEMRDADPSFMASNEWATSHVPSGVVFKQFDSVIGLEVTISTIDVMDPRTW